MNDQTRKFAGYIDSLPTKDKEALQRIINIVQTVMPDAIEGLSYGLPAFKYKNRPLIGFSSNKHGLNIYPFDPRIIAQVVIEFPGLNHSKGVIRFTAENPIPEKAVLLLIHLRQQAING